MANLNFKKTRTKKKSAPISKLNKLYCNIKIKWTKFYYF